MSDKKLIDPNDIYRAYKGADKNLTAQQQAAVQATHEGPVLVVAGAGSGKTELMAIRVLWLVANRFAKPQEILGLTFTKKAASELAKRINNGLLALEKTEYWPAELSAEGYALPTVSTYNAYANGIFRDSALSLGYEPESTLLTDGAAFALAKSVVLKHGHDLVNLDDDEDLKLNAIIQGVIKLAAQLNDNLQDGAGVHSEITKLRDRLSELASGSVASMNATNRDWFKGAFQTQHLIDLAETYRAEKKLQGAVDYSDQVKFAEQAARTNPQVSSTERSRFKFVLLDEYQDTSYLQTRLLLALYQDHPVFAVGDPNQSIYGWRGASATNLNEYLETFSSDDSKPVVQLDLPTSWRNPQVVLDVANLIADPLRHLTDYQRDRGLVPTRVERLEPTPWAEVGKIEVLWEEHTLAEANYVAAWLKERMSRLNDKGEKPTGAVLMRTRSQMQLFQQQLEEVGLETHIVGLGGLMQTPEIVDLVAALKVVHSPNAGTHLIRLLAGPRWRMSPKDISRLHRWSKQISRISDAQLEESADRSLGSEYEPSLVDALDLLLESPKLTLYGMSESSLVRLRDAAELFRRLRSQTGLPLTEFVKHVIRELQLDIELAANPRRTHPYSNLNAFNDIVASYSGSSTAYLGAFLDWLDYEADPDKIDTPAAATEKGVVQILTVHAAKGLEWDFVAVSSMSHSDFPSIKGKKGWIRAGELPYPLRGDRRSLPELDLTTANIEKDLAKIRNRFEDEMGEHLLREERRLAYVAFTRPKQELLISGSRWKPTINSSRNVLKPSVFMEEVVASGFSNVRLVKTNADATGLPEYDSQENPVPQSGVYTAWPLDPVGEAHRVNIASAAQAINANLKVQELADLPKPIPGQQRLVVEAPSDKLTSSLISEVDLLLGEKDELEANTHLVRLPVRIPASRFKDFVGKTADVAEGYRRPMPEEPFKATRDGTLFHSWIESRYGFISNADELDAVDLGLEEQELTEDELKKLQENFLKSEWADRDPLAIEEEIQVTIAQNTFICKLDAVFALDPEVDGKRIEIVDWKTGKAPTEAEIPERSLQLALYRMAYSRFYNIPEEQISVCLYYVADNHVIRPTSVLTEVELIAKWQSVLDTFGVA